MKKIECIIRPQKFEDVKEALGKIGVRGMTVTNVVGCGTQKGKTEVYRGSSYVIDLIQKIKIEVIVHEQFVEQIIATITENSRTGKVGDGKIFVSPVDNAIRIRTGEQGDEAI